ncbi:hypothetical protein PQE75_gp029 [Bacillus phage vB_BcoS-136]|uniref:Uncharacterized protein n=1 Tax=Bacillus phage vB_BcoS-136 TaxID=2419619 RepID=A0A3G3BVI5_9CAUD|nr:hypothetical protein PQE75_gp029 [Bacillus phage vB_BcoS-136]AYP68161.1 hypothetical protein vBBcoS136_00029 [Bacillus phage vB_BcoS-136]
MIKPQEGQMNYKSEEGLAFYYMFISACLTDEEREKLKLKWEEQGGFKVIPWWKFIMENTKVELDIK